MAKAQEDKITTLQGQINSSDKAVRLTAAHQLGEAMQSKALQREVLLEVNNHVHTTYSFSPYEPAGAAFAAWEAALAIVGSIDHDSISAAHEMLEASAMLGIASTVGFEVRSGFQETPFADKKINNPDSLGIAYMCVHGVPVRAIAAVDQFLAPIRAIRNIRNRAQVDALNALICDSALGKIDFELDVIPLSRLNEGGSITERHILSAFASKILKVAPAGKATVDFLETQLKISLTGSMRKLLLDPTNVHYHYDLLGVLKGNYLPRFFIQPSREETVDVKEVVNFALSIGAIPAYAYLGDVGESVTGDKKAEQFEDAYLDDLVAYLAKIGFPAITYMPPRNSEAQMERLQKLCRKHNLMEISGVDINSSRQSFNCPEMLAPGCIHLVDSAWALVAHEKLVNHDETWGLFHPNSPLATNTLAQRIEVYARLAKEMDPFEPTSILELASKVLR
ncbi:MAG: PHP domain-containing protein [Sphaerochaetaceae bacterium]|nr:PHP domain-containing protein [Sphaerochaetaceae bacterium]